MWATNYENRNFYSVPKKIPVEKYLALNPQAEKVSEEKPRQTLTGLPSRILPEYKEREKEIRQTEKEVEELWELYQGSNFNPQLKTLYNMGTQVLRDTIFNRIDRTPEPPKPKREKPCESCEAMRDIGIAFGRRMVKQTPGITVEIVMEKIKENFGEQWNKCFTHRG